MLSILPLTAPLLPYLDQVDSRYLVGELVSLKVSRLGFGLDYTPMNRAQWQVWRPTPFFHPQELVERDDVACFLAFVDGQLAGQAQVMQHFNRLAMVYDIRVAVGLRRAGVGEELIAACRDWARRQGLGGLLAETTDANPGACQFFEKCGFRLGGVDRMRYSALPEQASKPPALRDCALTFYQIF
ncbi:MAG: GNAT family N-acetyltransferase [Clostridia bacterium]|nr:GNAT family N-acetyltransferase [Clostridia bacterium]